MAAAAAEERRLPRGVLLRAGLTAGVPARSVVAASCAAPLLLRLLLLRGAGLTAGDAAAAAVGVTAAAGAACDAAELRRVWRRVAGPVGQEKEAGWNMQWPNNACD